MALYLLSPPLELGDGCVYLLCLCDVGNTHGVASIHRANESSDTDRCSPSYPRAGKQSVSVTRAWQDNIPALWHSPWWAMATSRRSHCACVWPARVAPPAWRPREADPCRL